MVYGNFLRNKFAFVHLITFYIKSPSAIKKYKQKERSDNREMGNIKEITDCETKLEKQNIKRMAEVGIVER